MKVQILDIDNKGQEHALKKITHFFDESYAKFACIENVQTHVVTILLFSRIDYHDSSILPFLDKQEYEFVGAGTIESSYFLSAPLDVHWNSSSCKNNRKLGFDRPSDSYKSLELIEEIRFKINEINSP